MTAVAGQLRFFLDENLLGLAKAMEIARRDVVHPGHPLLPAVPLGALGTQWIPTVAAAGLVVIGRDRRIRTKPAELALLRQHRLRVFWIAGSIT
jgi:hypothetical protein